MNKQIRRRVAQVYVVELLALMLAISASKQASCSEVVKQNSVAIEQDCTSISGVEISLSNQIYLSATIEQENRNLNKMMFGSYWSEGWSKTTLNVREEPSTDARIIGQLSFNEKISWTEYYNDEWLKIKYNDSFAFVSSEYVSLKELDYQSFSIPNYSGTKTWMTYTLFGKSTNQYALQQLATTDELGFRKVDNRYCVAIGSYFDTAIGQYFDLVLENGTIIECVMADQKADKHTDESNIFTTHTDCCSEFVVDKNIYCGTGNVGRTREDWNSKVVEIRVYNKNILLD